MHIAITGAHGVGKSTLHARISEEFAGSRLLQPVCEFPRARILQSNDNRYLDRDNNTPSKQMLFFIDHLVEEQKLEARGKTGLFDRFYLDYFAYLTVLFSHLLSDVEKAALSDLTRRKLQDYLILYVPIEFPIREDGVVESDTAFQRDIDDCIRTGLAESGVRFETIRGPLTDRVGSTLEVLRRRWPQHP